MKHLKEYKLFENTASQLYEEISDVFNDLRDDEFHVHLHKFTSMREIDIKIHKNVDGFKKVFFQYSDIKNIIDHLTSILEAYEDSSITISIKDKFGVYVEYSENPQNITYDINHKYANINEIHLDNRSIYFVMINIKLPNI